MKTLKIQPLLTKTLTATTLYLLLAITAANAQNPLGNADDLGIPQVEAGSGTIDRITNVLFFLAGGLSIVFIIIGGLMYIFSSGNPDTAKKARSTIIFALLGLAITILAYAIVQLVLGLTGGEEIKTL